MPYRTTDSEPTFQSLTEDDAYASLLPSGMPFPTALDSFACNRYEIAEFTRQAQALGIGYLGVCCGAGPHRIRAMAEALGRTPPASRYSADMSRHAFFGTDPQIPEQYKGYVREL